MATVFLKQIWRLGPRQIDPVWLVLRLLARLGLVWNVATPETLPPRKERVPLPPAATAMPTPPAALVNEPAP